MTARAVLDSSALISGLPDEVLDDLEHYASSMIVRAELAFGLHAFRAAGQTERVARRETLLGALDAIPSFWRPFDVAASEGYARLTASSPQAMRLKDALIAGHALSLGAPVITKDHGFTRFSSLTVRILD